MEFGGTLYNILWKSGTVHAVHRAEDIRSYVTKPRHLMVQHRWLGTAASQSRLKACAAVLPEFRICTLKAPLLTLRMLRAKKHPSIASIARHTSLAEEVVRF
eukprot:2011888-Amphidinium_carterae.3